MKRFIISLIATMLLSNGHASDVAGTVKSLKGQAHVLRLNQKIDVTVGMALQTRDTLISGPASSVGITLQDSTLLTTGPNARIEIHKYAFDRRTNGGHLDASVHKGTLAVVSGLIAKNNPGQVIFRTQTVTLGVRGTEFIIDADPSNDQRH